MTTNYAAPKLLLEFYKGEKVPPLVTKYDYDSRVSSTPARDRRQPSGQTVISALTNEKEKELEREIEQNRELRLIIKELQEKLEKLVIVNAELIERIEQLQKRAQSLSQISDKNAKELNRKVKIQVYKQVQEYLTLAVERFTQNLSNLKMTPLIENRIQEFCEEILNINTLSVRKMLKPLKQAKGKNIFDEDEVNKTIKEIVERHSKSKQKQKQRQLDRSRYNAVLERLNKQSEGFRPGKIVTKESSTPEHHHRTENKERSSNKRPRIFNNRPYQTEQRSRSRDYVRKLDF